MNPSSKFEVLPSIKTIQGTGCDLGHNGIGHAHLQVDHNPIPPIQSKKALSQEHPLGTSVY